MTSTGRRSPARILAGALLWLATAALAVLGIGGIVAPGRDGGTTGAGSLVFVLLVLVGWDEALAGEPATLPAIS